jgi:nucleoside 2-deoxyribosyltransferase
MKIYIGGKISGATYDQCVKYFKDTMKELRKIGYEVFSPMTAKEYLRTEYADRELPNAGYSGAISPVATNHAIFERDQWCVRNCDVFYLNLLPADDKASLGGTMELAWASLLGKHTIVVMQKKNVHRHAFVLEAADLVFETHKEAMEYLYKFITQTG